MPRIADSKIVLLPVAAILVFVPCGRAEFDPTQPHHLKIGEPKRFHASLGVKVDAPRMNAAEWIIVTPAPPENDVVRRIDLQIFVGDKLANGRPNAELSELFRPVISAQVPAGDGPLASGIDFRVDYDIELRPRRLVAGAPASKAEPLNHRTREVFLRSSGTTDWTAPSFGKWLDETGLRRGETESDMAFAYRVFSAIVKNAKYESPAGDRHPSVVCATQRSDCGGLALLYTAALRANKIPARTLWGRWAKPQEGDYGQYHVKAEFFAQDIGWVPVEVAGAITWKNAKPEDCFGRDNGDFIAMHEDTDMLIDSIHFGKQPVGWRQGVLWWVKGSGDLKNMQESETWNVGEHKQR